MTRSVVASVNINRQDLFKSKAKITSLKSVWKKEQKAINGQILSYLSISECLKVLVVLNKSIPCPSTKQQIFLHSLKLKYLDQKQPSLTMLNASATLTNIFKPKRPRQPSQSTLKKEIEELSPKNNTINHGDSLIRSIAEFFSLVFCPQLVHMDTLMGFRGQSASGNGNSYLKTRVDFEIDRDAVRTLTQDPSFTKRH